MAARTAVVAGTATAVSGRVQRRQAARYQQQDDAAAYQQEQQYAPPPQQQYAPPPPQYAPAPAAPAAPAADPMAELQKLADMKTAGLLTDEEFTAMKAKIIAG
jgi:hypothetical protein